METTESKVSPAGEKDFFELQEAWDGLAVVTHLDRTTGSWFFVALHDDTLGGPVGGCRLRVYPRPEDGLLDAMRLARGMTFKWAGLGMPFGGGKAVLAVPRPMVGDEREALFRRFGGFLTSLKGIYRTGEDLGTTPDDMAVVAQETRHLMGGDPESGHPVDPGPFTALGVFEGIRSALRHRVGSDDLEGRTVLVQGVGDVGEPLCRMLFDAGARLLLADLDEARARSLAEDVEGRVVSAREVYGTECDVFAPCAVGGVLDEETIPWLECRIVAGSANNQLQSEERDAEALRKRGILYAPDYIINGGGAMAFGLFHQGMDDEEEVRRRVASIGDTLDVIFSEAAEAGISPLVAASRRVERILDEARRNRGSSGSASS